MTSLALIADLADILAKPERVLKSSKKNWMKLCKFGDQRRTELMVGEVLSLEDEDLIEESDVLITLSNKGYIKRLDQAEFTAQNVVAAVFKRQALRMTILFSELVSTSTHDHLLSLQIKDGLSPERLGNSEYGRTAKGLPVVNLFEIG